MPPLQELLTPALVSLIITSVLAPLLFFTLKRYDEREKRNFDVRYAEYKKYLGALEDIAASSRLDVNQTFGKFFFEIQKDMLADSPENAGKHVLRALEELDKYVARARDAMTRSRSELRGLRLVCSEELLRLLNEFVAAQEDLMNDSISMVQQLKAGNDISPETIVSPEMKTKASRNAQLFEAILMQMRKELKISGT